MAGTARERAFGAAVETFLAGGSPLDRALTFASSMKAYAADAPSDVEAMAFAARGALYVLRYAPPAERVQRAEEAIALAERVVAANPDHPGGVHYLIHATDSPRFAARGLSAARGYDKLAPDADHALHMPSHIFLQLGVWDDVTASNERAWAASKAWVARGDHNVSELGWHSLHWLQYGYLQQGRYKDARALIDSARATLDGASPDALAGKPDVQYTVETLSFQYAAETGRWDAFPRPLAGATALARRASAASSPREQQMASNAAYHAAVAAMLGGGRVRGGGWRASVARRDRVAWPTGTAPDVHRRVGHAARRAVGAGARDQRPRSLRSVVWSRPRAKRLGAGGPRRPRYPRPRLRARGCSRRDARAIRRTSARSRTGRDRSTALLGLARASGRGRSGGSRGRLREAARELETGRSDIAALAEARSAIQTAARK